MEYEQNLKVMRKIRKQSQREIANVLQTTQQQYCKYENGIQEMPIRHLIALCKHYNVSADYILGLPKGLPYGYSQTRG